MSCAQYHRQIKVYPMDILYTAIDETNSSLRCPLLVRVNDVVAGRGQADLGE
jgi:hypothetical protein